MLLVLGCVCERVANVSSNSTGCVYVSTVPSLRTVLAAGQCRRRTSRSEHDFVAPSISHASKCRLGSASNLEKSLNDCFVIHFQVVSHDLGNFSTGQFAQPGDSNYRVFGPGFEGTLILPGQTALAGWSINRCHPTIVTMILPSMILSYLSRSDR